MSDIPAIYWVGFNLLVLAMLAVDLLVFNRKAHEVKVKEALIWSAVWISVSMLLLPVVYQLRGPEGVKVYLAGYILEKALSVDNLFVFVLIFKSYRVEAKYQHRILFWGILGALVLRGIMIFAGGALVASFHWILYLFGIFLIYTAIKLMGGDEEEMDPANSPVMRFAHRFLPMSSSNEHHGKFWVKENGKRVFTSLFVVLLIVEATDLVFAVDSIPAIFGITQDVFIIYVSNVMAILGLRALYFALAGLVDMFYYLKHGLSMVLGFIGLKMLIPAIPHESVPLGMPIHDGAYHMPVEWALGVILGVFGLAILASVMRARHQARKK